MRHFNRAVSTGFLWFALPSWSHSHEKVGNDTRMPRVGFIGDRDTFFDAGQIFGPEKCAEDFAGDRDEPMMDVGPVSRVLKVRIHARKW